MTGTSPSFASGHTCSHTDAGITQRVAPMAIRIPHKGNIQNDVTEGVFRVLEDFEAVDESVHTMKALLLQPLDQIAYATAALALRFRERGVEQTGGMSRRLSRPSN
jgi:hypothetical protein